MKKVSKNKIIIATFVSLVIATASIFAVFPKTTPKAEAKTAEQLGEEIKALQAQIDGAEKRASGLRDKSNTLQAELNGIAQEKSVIESQIKISQIEYDKLQIEIKNTEDKIQTNRKALGTILAEMAVQGDVTPIEQIAGSNNISTALDKIEYQNAVKDSLVQKVDDIKKDKEKLEKKRDGLKVSLANQQKSKDALKAKIDEQNKILEETKGEEAQYTRYAQERAKDKAKKMQEQQNAIEAAMRRSAAAAGGSGMIQVLGGSTSYPWNSSNCYVDANAISYGGAGNGTDGLGYGCRQCVSYVAWKILSTRGVRAVNWGNANQWPSSARAAGFSTGSAPRAGALGVMYNGPYGHIVYVESVEGNSVVVSQYNYNTGSGWGQFSRMKVPASTYGTYIYF